METTEPSTKAAAEKATNSASEKSTKPSLSVEEDPINPLVS